MNGIVCIQMFISPIWANLALTHANTHKQHRTCFGIGEDSPCVSQRTENRVRKKHVFASVCWEVMKGWGGVGRRHVKVPCASSATCCYAAQMSGSVASVYTLSKWSAVLEGWHIWVASACVRRSWMSGVGGNVKVPCASSCSEKKERKSL